MQYIVFYSILSRWVFGFYYRCAILICVFLFRATVTLFLNFDHSKNRTPQTNMHAIRNALAAAAPAVRTVSTHAARSAAAHANASSRKRLAETIARPATARMRSMSTAEILAPNPISELDLLSFDEYCVRVCKLVS